MTLPVNALKTKYEELSQLFLTEINNQTIILYYPPQTTLTANVASVNSEPNVFDAYGGRQPLDQFTDRKNESGQQSYFAETTGSIQGRTYWNTKKFDKNGNVINDDNTCKLITDNANQYKILNADHAIINDKKVKLLQPPIPYGLFGKQYCISLWKVI